MASKPQWRARATEALVIVGSILVAFAIDAWWDGRQAEEDLVALVDLLVADVEADVSELRGRAARSDTLISMLESLTAAGLGTAAAPSRAELPHLVRAVGGTSQTDPSLSAYEVVRGSDAWNRIPPDIKVSISEYMRGPYSVDRDRDSDAVRSLLDLAGRYGGAATWFTDEPEVGSQVLDYLRDPATQTWIGVHRRSLMAERAWQRRWIERLPSIVNRLAALKSN